MIVVLKLNLLLRQTITPPCSACYMLRRHKEYIGSRRRYIRGDFYVHLYSRLWFNKNHNVQQASSFSGSRCSFLDTRCERCPAKKPWQSRPQPSSSCWIEEPNHFSSPNGHNQITHFGVTNIDFLLSIIKRPASRAPRFDRKTLISRWMVYGVNDLTISLRVYATASHYIS